MAAEERNFRSYYYDKFGIRVVEEKKSVEILMKEQTVSIEKLQQFCLRFPVPAVYRILVWKLLLGVLPAHHNSQPFVQQQREQQFEDLKGGLKMTGRARDTDPVELTLLKLYLLEQGQLPFEDSELLGWEEYRYFASMAKGVSKVMEDELDQYWVSSRFFQLVAKHRDTIALYPEVTLKCLRKEDAEKTLWDHLVHHRLLAFLPLRDWFNTCFVNVLPQVSFQRLWDKIVGGSLYVMVYVAVAILIFFRRPLMSMTSPEDMVNFLEKIPEDCGDRIVVEAFDLWSKNGSLHLISKADSPAVEKGKG
ncbi:hypothetical protein ACOMHN_007602 [Nucella lapillus]